MTDKFYGKYRGRVIDNLDPLELGRLMVSAPGPLGLIATAWAMPCVPYAGSGVGFFMMPPIDAWVWVEFEGGDLDYPIWSGCFWAEDQVPAEPAVPTTKVLKTASCTLTLNDLDGEGGFSLTVNPPAAEPPISISASSSGGLSLTVGTTTIVVRETGVTITADPGIVNITPEGVSLNHGAASVELTEPQVSINDGALEVI